MLEWRPELRYYEERIGVLRTLEDRKMLNAFKVDDEQAGGILFDGGCELIIRQTSWTS